MKKTLLIIISLLLNINLAAQSAQDYLNNVIEKTKAYNDINIIFNHRIINKEAGINESMSGYGSMKGNSYKINVNGQELISNGELLWTYLIEEGEVMISEVTEDNNSSPIAIISSFSQNIKANFINSNDNNIKVIEVEEIEGETFEKIIISIDNNDYKIKKIHIYGTDNNEFVYEIIDFTTNQDLPDSMFIFNESLHPNVEVIDMR
ncbi:MAG: outer membrane lipoprotein carrier protein LolA [Bacteroidales bacterium]|nr:outer membrane lipoprotein carrier protein LolA [Bacteroidales bacterium]